MKQWIRMPALCFSLVWMWGGIGHADVNTSQAAPNFVLKDYTGNVHSLAAYEGQYVVLEWVNYDCPFVKKHYETSRMQDLQRVYTAKGVVWLSICSSAQGKQGQFDTDTIASMIEERMAQPTAYLIDLDGSVGRAYGAKTTPHMFVIDPKGILIYQGAIDDHPYFWQKGFKNARNYVDEVLSAALAGNDVALSQTKPYGCSVKY